MARNHKFFFDSNGIPKARGPASEKILMSFLEVDVQGSDHICRDLMDDLTAIEDESDDTREFNGNAHTVIITAEGVTITNNFTGGSSEDDTSTIEAQASTSASTGDKAAVNPAPESQPYLVALKHFREILEDWEAFILDDQLDDPLLDDDYL